MSRSHRQLVFLLLATWFFCGALFTFAKAPGLSLYDFQAFWGAGKALNAGMDPYDAGSMRQLSLEVPFLSPIFVAELFQPITMIPFHRAKLIFAGLDVVGAFVMVPLLLALGRQLDWGRWERILLGVAVLMAFELFSAGIYLGQTDLIVVLALAASAYCLDRGHRFLAGLVFCVSAMNPHLATGIGLYYLFRTVALREYSLLLGMAAGVVPVVAGCLAHDDYFIEWVTRVLPSQGYAQVGSLIQITLVNLIGAFGVPAGITISESIYAAMLALLLFWSADCRSGSGGGFSARVWRQTWLLQRF